ncbi:MAG: hypothetical protein WCW03_00095 [Candidatus Paceibacterota bacterium]|jgi:hypothetical protein
MQQYETVENNFLKIRNAMQIELARRFYGFDDSKKIIEWTEKYSKAFGIIVNNDPSLISRYATHREEVMDEIEEMLYVERVTKDMV